MSFIVVPLTEKDKPVSYSDMQPDEIAYHVYELNKGDSKKSLDYLRSYASTHSDNADLSKKFMRAADIVRSGEDNEKRMAKVRQKRTDTKKARQDVKGKEQKRHETIANSVSKYLDSAKSTKDLQSDSMWKLINKLPDESSEKKDILQRVHDYLAGNQEFKKDTSNEVKSDVQKALFKKSGEVRKNVQTKHVKDKQKKVDKQKPLAPKSKEAAKQTLEIGKTLETSKFTDEEKKELEKAISKVPSAAKRKHLTTKLLKSESAPMLEADEENFNAVLSSIKNLSGDAVDSETNANVVDEPEEKSATWDELKPLEDKDKEEEPKDKSAPVDDSNVKDKVTIQPEEKGKSLFHFTDLDEALQYYDKNPTVFTREVLKLIDEYNKFAKSRNLELINTFKELPKDIDDENLEDIFVLNKFLTQV